MQCSRTTIGKITCPPSLSLSLSQRSSGRPPIGWRTSSDKRLDATSSYSSLSSSSSNGSGNGKGGDGEGKIKRSGPIRIKATPRSAAAARLRKIKTMKGLGHVSDNYAKYAPDLEAALPHPLEENKFKLANYGEESLYTLVLLRHGESEWNKENRYTGWTDVNLTKQGEIEARTAGRLLYENGIEIDHAFTSVLKRASFSTNMCLNMAKQHWVPVTKSWRLNERHYGSLQGYNKDTAWQDLGLDQELVMQMRRSYDVAPPKMEDDHPYWHGNDRRYKQLAAEQLESSRTESLKDAADRVLPFYKSLIVPSMRTGNKCLVVSHANTIRTLVKYIDRISDEDIKSMTIPTGIPLLYRLDKNMRPVDPKRELEFQYMVEPKGYMWATSHALGFHGVYLGDVERLQGIQEKRDASNRDWQRIILRNVGKSLGWEMDQKEQYSPSEKQPPKVLETRQLWWKIHEKMQTHEYGNMLLLQRMEDELEQLLNQSMQRFITMRQYESMIDRIHLDSEGKLVQPFVALNDRQSREEREKQWFESLTSDLEEEGLIR